MAEGNVEATEDASFDFITTIKTLLEMTDDSQDKVLQIYFEMVKQEVLNYCNISTLPEALSYPVCSIVADLYRENTNKNKVGNIVGNVSSVSEDGRTVSFSANSSELSSAIKTKVLGISQLNRFKKLYRLN